MWIKSEQNIGGHPKTRRFARTLGISLAAAVGHLHLLWWHAVEYAPDGDLSQYGPNDIADAAMWEGDADAFLAALTSSGHIERTEGGTHISDWEFLFGETDRKRKARNSYMKDYMAARREGGVRSNDEANDDSRDASDASVRSNAEDVNAELTPLEREREREREKDTPPPTPPSRGAGRGDAQSGDSPTRPNVGPPRSDTEDEVRPAMTVEAFGEGFEAAAIAGCTLSQVIEAWNGALGPLGFPRVAKGTPARERAFRARVAERVERRDLTWWRERIAQLAASPFMRQSAFDRANWLTFDWILNENNLVKIVEGKYDKAAQPLASPSTSRPLDTLDRIRGLSYEEAKAVIDATPDPLDAIKRMSFEESKAYASGKGAHAIMDVGYREIGA